MNWSPYQMMVLQLAALLTMPHRSHTTQPFLILNCFSPTVFLLLNIIFIAEVLQLSASPSDPSHHSPSFIPLELVPHFSALITRADTQRCIPAVLYLVFAVYQA